MFIQLKVLNCKEKIKHIPFYVKLLVLLVGLFTRPSRMYPSIKASLVFCFFVCMVVGKQKLSVFAIISTQSC